jgi:hypothetical protein
LKAKELKIQEAKLQFDLVESCRQRGIDPVSEFWKTLALVDDPAIKAKLLLEIFEYIYPKKKAVEHTLDLTLGGASLSHQEIKAILSADPFAIPAPKGNNGTDSG